MQTQTPDYSQKIAHQPPTARHEVRNWVFSEPPEDVIDTKLQLLTVAGVSVCGYWSGFLGQFFSAWSPLHLGH